MSWILDIRGMRFYFTFLISSTWPTSSSQEISVQQSECLQLTKVTRSDRVGQHLVQVDKNLNQAHQNRRCLSGDSH